MSIKPFAIQGSDLTLGGVNLQAGATAVVIPGVTQAVNYNVEEVNERDGSNPSIFGSNEGAVTVIDNAEYLYLVDDGDTPSGSYVAATYSVDELDDGQIEEINVESAGVFLSADKTRVEAGNMWATTTPTPFVSFNSANWTQIPYRPKMRANEVESIGGDGAGVVERSVVFPGGENGDTRGTIADVGEGVLYYCTQDYEGPSEPIEYTVVASEAYNKTQSINGTDMVVTVLKGSNSDIDDIMSMLTLPSTAWQIYHNDHTDGATWDCVADEKDSTHWSFTWQFHAGNDNSSFSQDDEFTVYYTAAQIAIWERVQSGDTVQFRFAGNIYQEQDDAPNRYNIVVNAEKDIVFNTDEGSHEFRFTSDGGIKFPDGTTQTTAYTGQSGGGSGELYIMANIDGDIVTSTNGIDWNDPQASGMTGISKVEIHGGVIVYIPGSEGPASNNGLYYSTQLGTVTLCAGTDVSVETDDELYWREVHYFSSTDKWVAVGYNAGDNNHSPVLAHSDNGIAWTVVFVDTQFVAGFNTGNNDWQLNDVAYLDETNQYIITSSLNGELFGGIFLTSDITTALSGATHVAVDADFDEVAPWSVVGLGGPPGYMALMPDDESDNPVWFGYGTNVEDYAPDFMDGLSDFIRDELGYLPNITEVAYRNGTFIAVTNDGQVITPSFAMGSGFVISIPLPYTNTGISISNTNPAVISWNGGTNEEQNNEKIVVTLAGEYNGTYYVGSDNTLYTDLAMESGLDASGFAAFTSGTVTFSHGQYFDAAGASNSYFYIGNDDEQIFRSSNGITWTQQADVTGDYFNDFAYGSFGVSTSADLIGDGHVDSTGYKYTVYADSGNYQGGESNPGVVVMENSDHPYSVGDVVIFRNGEVRTITEVVSWDPGVKWIKWSGSVPGGDENPRFPITVQSSNYAEETKPTARIKPDLTEANAHDHYMKIYAGNPYPGPTPTDPETPTLVDSLHIHMAGAQENVELFLGTDANYVSTKEAGDTPAGVRLHSEVDVAVVNTDLRLDRKGSTWVSVYGDGENVNLHNSTYDLSWSTIAVDDHGDYYVGGEANAYSEAIINKYSRDGQLLWSKYNNGDDYDGWQFDGVAYHNNQVATLVQTDFDRDYNYYKLSVLDSGTGDLISTTDIYDPDGRLEAHSMIHHSTLGWTVVGRTRGEVTTSSSITDTNNPSNYDAIRLLASACLLDGYYPENDSGWRITGTNIGAGGQNLGTGVGYFVNKPVVVQEGSGATFNITNNGNGTYSAGLTASANTNYRVGHKIKILGTSLTGQENTTSYGAAEYGGGYGAWKVTDDTEGNTYLIFLDPSTSTQVTSLLSVGDAIIIEWGSTEHTTTIAAALGLVPNDPYIGSFPNSQGYLLTDNFGVTGQPDLNVGYVTTGNGTYAAGATPDNDIIITVDAVTDGVISSVSNSGTAAGTSVATANDVSGANYNVGSGARARVYMDYNNGYYYVDYIETGGSNYVNLDNLRVLGSELGGVDGGLLLVASMVTTNGAISYFSKATYPTLNTTLNAVSGGAFARFLGNNAMGRVTAVTDNGDGNWSVAVTMTRGEAVGGDMAFFAGNDLEFTSGSTGALNNTYNNIGVPSLQYIYIDMNLAGGYVETAFKDGTFVLTRQRSGRPWIWNSDWTRFLEPVEDSTNLGAGGHAYCVAEDPLTQDLVVGGYIETLNASGTLVWKLNDAGVTQWAKTIDGDDNSVSGIAVSSIDSGIYVSTDYVYVHKLDSSGGLIKTVGTFGMWGVNRPEVALAIEEDGFEYVYVGGDGGSIWGSDDGFYLSKLTTDLATVWGRSMWSTEDDFNSDYDSEHTKFVLGKGQASIVGFGYPYSDNLTTALIYTISTRDQFEPVDVLGWQAEQRGSHTWGIDTGLSMYNIITAGATASTATALTEIETDSLAWTNYAFQSKLINLNTAKRGIVGVETIEFADGGTLDHNPADIPPSVLFDPGNQGWEYTLQLSDRGRFIMNQTVPNTSSVQDLTVYVPRNDQVAFPVGTVITLINSNSSTAGGNRIYVRPIDWDNNDGWVRIWSTNGSQNSSIWSFQGIQTATLMKISTNAWLLTANNLTDED